MFEFAFEVLATGLELEAVVSGLVVMFSSCKVV